MVWCGACIAAVAIGSKARSECIQQVGSTSINAVDPDCYEFDCARVVLAVEPWSHTCRIIQAIPTPLVHLLVRSGVKALDYGFGSTRGAVRLWICSRDARGNGQHDVRGGVPPASSSRRNALLATTAIGSHQGVEFHFRSRGNNTCAVHQTEHTDHRTGPQSKRDLERSTDTVGKFLGRFGSQSMAAIALGSVEEESGTYTAWS
ncbi:hypothetical protein EDC04DRAFT_2597666 [Pisolithus marmoratus]|nr:hypothetical protein EDC04DRAFT_2597666 [Pisolithus marmoratus]